MSLSFTISSDVTHPLAIQSSQNERFRRWLRFANRPGAEDCPWVLLSGWKQISELSRCRRPQLLLFSRPEDPELAYLQKVARQSIRLPGKLLKRLSGVRQDQGVLAFFEKPTWKWEEATPFLLYLMHLQDPGNLGTLFRTAAAAQDFSIVTAPETVSCYNGKVVRASAGYLFEVPFFQGIELDQIVARGYRCCRMTPRGGTSLFDADLTPPLAVVIGNEGSGFQSVDGPDPASAMSIPMSARVDSLNAAISGSLVVYEIMRRRLQA